MIYLVVWHIGKSHVPPDVSLSCGIKILVMPLVCSVRGWTDIRICLYSSQHFSVRMANKRRSGIHKRQGATTELRAGDSRTGVSV
jgi:hypothetical protein